VTHLVVPVFAHLHVVAARVTSRCAGCRHAAGW
jgi:hypothetical protein